MCKDMYVRVDGWALTPMGEWVCFGNADEWMDGWLDWIGGYMDGKLYLWIGYIRCTGRYSCNVDD